MNFIARHARSIVDHRCEPDHGVRARRRASPAWVVALACAGAAAPSIADVVTETASAGKTSGPLNVAPGGSSYGQIVTPASAQTLDFSGFDGTLGTLTGVQISYTYQYSYTVSTTAYNPVPSMSALYSLRQNLTAPGTSNVQSSCGPGGTCRPVSLTGRNALFVDVFMGTSPLFSKTAQVSPGSLQTYVSKPVQITLTDPGSTDTLSISVTNPSFIANSLRIDTALTATLSYSYTPAAVVPEPGTSALMAGGLALLTCTRRKRRERQTMAARPAM